MKNYNFDGHKLSYHPGRVAQYLEKGECMPLYAEISPVGNCNHRCLFCAYDFIGHPNRRLATMRLKEIVTDMAMCGVKSIVLAGEGEPLLHPDIAEIIAHTKQQGIDIGLFTNGQALSSALAGSILPHLTFVRFSFNGGNLQDYANVHQVKPSVFDRVIQNMTHSAELKKNLKLTVDIGAQFVLIPENQASLFSAAEALKEAGLDYLAVKPFVLQRNEQFYAPVKEFNPAKLEKQFAKAECLTDDRFEVVVRRDGFVQQTMRSYEHCRGCSFTTVINSGGDVATCLPYWDRPEYVYGNIYQNDFSEIWQGSRRRALQGYLEQELDTNECPPRCRPNAINAYLSEIRNPSMKHVNFI